MKVVVLSHGHPVFSKGGGEYAAYYLWQGLNREPGVEAWFVGRAHPEALHSFSTLAVMGERDYLIGGNAIIADLTATTPLGADSDFAELLRQIDPDVVHFHHYVHLGIELLRVVRNACPRARIVMTLHEFIAICVNNGQMVKTDGRLCFHYSPRECNLCFRHLKPEDFFLRERYIKSFFALADAFISPSDFLRRRYLDWGLETRHFEVIENGLPEDDRVPPRTLADGEPRGRFAYFGQINPYKGVDVILEAIAGLPKASRKSMSLDIFGGSLEYQPEAFRQKVETLLAACGNTVHLHGVYDPAEIGRLMREVDWVVMGSIWWENSPLVIQEAYKFGRPVICPDIGGMAEKVVDGVGGLTYRARDSVSLAALIKRILADAALFDRLCRTLPPYPALRAITRQHLDLYESIGQGIAV
ncbi:MAG: glycosyltransferase family 4 protein [Rhizobiales bacterium]|nr:glycosyltransferase family 4 protein [Hyphomicrobiales bacterium]MBI3672822.1 glycosyltransferase family 4 protein [Hyphomicrobiales bacterium]